MSATIPLPRNPGIFARNAPDAEEMANAQRTLPVVQLGEVLTPTQADIPLEVVGACAGVQLVVVLLDCGSALARPNLT